MSRRSREFGDGFWLGVGLTALVGAVLVAIMTLGAMVGLW